VTQRVSVQNETDGLPRQLNRLVRREGFEPPPLRFESRRKGEIELTCIALPAQAPPSKPARAPSSAPGPWLEAPAAEDFDQTPPAIGSPAPDPKASGMHRYARDQPRTRARRAAMSSEMPGALKSPSVGPFASDSERFVVRLVISGCGNAASSFYPHRIVLSSCSAGVRPAPENFECSLRSRNRSSLAREASRQRAPPA
jgi:hypothetical protein